MVYRSSSRKYEGKKNLKFLVSSLQMRRWKGKEVSRTRYYLEFLGNRNSNPSIFIFYCCIISHHVIRT
jgi:hypothetical protein